MKKKLDRKGKETGSMENRLELVRRFAHRLPEKELLRVAAQILETFGFICIPPGVVAKGKKKTG